MRIYLVRHAQSEWQLCPTDDWDLPLSSLGRLQATHLAAWLARSSVVDTELSIDVEAIYSSPLLRARETADILARALDVPVHTLETAREATFHVASHLPGAEHPNSDAGVGI